MTLLGETFNKLEGKLRCYLVRLVLEEDPVSLHVGEVLLGLLGGGSTQTFVVLDAVRVPVVGRGLPFRKFRQRVERETLQRKKQPFRPGVFIQVTNEAQL